MLYPFWIHDAPIHFVPGKAILPTKRYHSASSPHICHCLYATTFPLILRSSRSPRIATLKARCICVIQTHSTHNTVKSCVYVSCCPNQAEMWNPTFLIVRVGNLQDFWILAAKFMGGNLSIRRLQMAGCKIREQCDHGDGTVLEIPPPGAVNECPHGQCFFCLIWIILLVSCPDNCATNHNQSSVSCNTYSCADDISLLSKGFLPHHSDRSSPYLLSFVCGNIPCHRSVSFPTEKPYPDCRMHLSNWNTTCVNVRHLKFPSHLIWNPIFLFSLNQTQPNLWISLESYRLFPTSDCGSFSHQIPESRATYAVFV